MPFEASPCIDVQVDRSIRTSGRRGRAVEPHVPPVHTTARLPAAASGLVAAALGLGAGELVAGFARSLRSPVEAVANSVIDRSPQSVTKFGIETFGSNDKLALVVSILLILALAAPLVGVLSRRRPVVGDVAFGGVALVGALAALDQPNTSLLGAVPAVVAGVVGALTLRRLHATASAPDATPADPAGGAPRRAFLVQAGALTALAAAGAAGGRALRSRFSAAASRAALVLPRARQPLPAVPAGVEVGVDGVSPFVTPNKDFYRVDTALTVPQVPVEDWTLRIHGMVERELEIDFDQLAERGLIEADITLVCVSNPVGGELIDHARWLGVPLATLLDEVGVDDRADQVVGRSIDGYTCGFPVSAAYDRTALVAVGMNGEPLPLEHGFPARLVTPGLFGYVSATKWLTEIELTTFESFESYWVPRGYATEAPVKTGVRIDVPRSGQIIPPGPAVLAGVAWAPHRGISKVEVQIDGGEWQDALLADELNDNSWRQWKLDWEPESGARRVTVRATDGDGELQTQERSEILPDGASGWLTRLVTVQS